MLKFFREKIPQSVLGAISAFGLVFTIVSNLGSLILFDQFLQWLSISWILLTNWIWNNVFFFANIDTYAGILNSTVFLLGIARAKYDRSIAISTLQDYRDNVRFRYIVNFWIFGLIFTFLFWLIFLLIDKAFLVELTALMLVFLLMIPFILNRNRLSLTKIFYAVFIMFSVFLLVQIMYISAFSPFYIALKYHSSVIPLGAGITNNEYEISLSAALFVSFFGICAVFSLCRLRDLAGVFVGVFTFSALIIFSSLLAKQLQALPFVGN